MLLRTDVTAALAMLTIWCAATSMKENTNKREVLLLGTARERDAAGQLLTPLPPEIDPNTIRSIPGDKIFYVQLADAPAFDMDVLYWSRHFRNMPGEGELACTDFMRAVMATGYTGPISLEIFNDQFRGGCTAQVALDGYRSIIASLPENGY